MITFINEKVSLVVRGFKVIILGVTILFILVHSNNSYAAVINKSVNHPIPVILDTDMGFDDWMALLYIAKNKKINLVAVTVDCNGETYCENDAGARNVAKILMLAGKPHVNVYSGTSKTIHYWPTFPTIIRKQAMQMNIPTFKQLSFSREAIKSMPASQALVMLIDEAGKQHKPITLISIGSATNIDDAWQFVSHQSKRARNLFKQGVAMIYKGGGAVGLPLTKSKKDKHAHLTNYRIPGNLFIPGIYATNNTQAAWNIYVAAEKAEDLLQSSLPITFIPINLSNQLPITKLAYDTIRKSAHGRNAASFVTHIILDTIHSQGGWETAELDFWDPSVVVAALNPKLVKKQYTDVPVCVNTRNKQHFIDGYINGHLGMIPIISYLPKSAYFYGTLLINIPYDINSTKKMYNTNACDFLQEKAKRVRIYTQIDKQEFYKEFTSVF